MTRAKVHLLSDEVLEVEILNKDSMAWVQDVAVRGIVTKDAYIPHHAINFISFDEFEDVEATEYRVEVKLGE